jgi:hypothetical protein
LFINDLLSIALELDFESEAYGPDVRRSQSIEQEILFDLGGSRQRRRVGAEEAAASPRDQDFGGFAQTLTEAPYCPLDRNR